MAAAALLFATRGPSRLRAAAWAAIALVGLASGLLLNLRPANLSGSNFLHYYFGAKYPIRYDDFYRVIQAGRGEPQLGMRDLQHPARHVRSTDPERRAYYLDLMRTQGRAVDSRVDLDSLAREARRVGAVSTEADEILRRGLAERYHDSFVADVHEATDSMTGRPLVDDYGYNGSPFYAWIRHADPALHRDLDARVGLFALLWQVLAAIVFVVIVARALRFDLECTIAAAAMLLASWDFEGYALPGLVFGEVWIPIAVAAFALRRRWPVLAGAGIAWAGLVKLFPFVLVVPPLARAVRARMRREPGDPADGQTAFATLAFAVLLVAISSTPDRSWLGFFGKIHTEFLGIRMLNNVSFGSSLQVLGVRPESWLLPLLQGAALLAIAPIFFVPGDSPGDPGPARRSLVLVAATGLIAASWQNYYAVLPLVLLPFYARESPRMAALLAASFAVSYLLPEFDGRVLKEAPWLHLAKLFPYWATPVCLIARELRLTAWTARTRRWVPRVALALMALSVVEVTRIAVARNREARGDARLAAGDAAGAHADYRMAARFAPEDSDLPMSEGEALAALGRLDEARERFEHAVRLRPGDALLRDNYARLLMMSDAWAEAGVQLEYARGLSPDDPEILASLARVRRVEGRVDDARRLLARAHELAPTDAMIVALQYEMRAR